MVEWAIMIRSARIEYAGKIEVGVFFGLVADMT